MSDSALPPEMIEAILRLLPAKSLGRFKCVSKTWNSLISDPHFIKKHLQHHQTTTKLILESAQSLLVYSMDTNQLLNISSSDGDGIPATAKEFIFGSPPIKWLAVLGSCNGLVLVNDVNLTIFVINLTTQERWEVPPFVFPNGRGYVTYGFGYDSSTDDYKVVVIHDVTIAFGLAGTFVSVYSLRNNSWKRLSNSKCYGGFRLQRSLPVVVNENVHWLTKFSTIVSFSFTTEEFNELSLQNLVHAIGGTALIYKLFDIGGKLGVLFRKEDKYELCVMEDYGVGSSWTIVCVLKLKKHVTLVSLVEGSNRDILLAHDPNIFVFNIDEEKYRTVRIEGHFGEFFALGIYVESLESPKRIMTPP